MGEKIIVNDRRGRDKAPVMTFVLTDKGHELTEIAYVERRGGYGRKDFGVFTREQLAELRDKIDEVLDR